MATKPRAADIFTPEFRGSFVHVFDFENNPATGQPGDKHSVTMLYPKLSADWRTDLPTLYANLLEALNNTYPGYAGMPPIFNDHMSKAWPVKDGDLPNDRGNVLEGHPGHWVVRAASKNFAVATNLVKVVAGPQGQPQAIPVSQAECFSGCYFEAQVNAYQYDKGGNIGIAFGLNNLKWTRTGESLGGGGQSAAAAWGAEPVAAAAAFQPGAAPVAPVAPLPVATVAPVAPLPVAPVAPVAPLPVAPLPVAPVAPAPVYPAAPLPVVPVAPAPVAPTFLP